jgi:hypothetical protein
MCLLCLASSLGLAGEFQSDVIASVIIKSTGKEEEGGDVV